MPDLPSLPNLPTEHAAWIRVLDKLEADVDAVMKDERGGWDSERLTQLAAWKAPRRLGPIPAGQVDRALRLLEVQHDLIRRLETVQRTTGQHLRAIRSVPNTHGGDQAVYLDVSG